MRTDVKTIEFTCDICGDDARLTYTGSLGRQMPPGWMSASWPGEWSTYHRDYCCQRCLDRDIKAWGHDPRDIYRQPIDGD